MATFYVSDATGNDAYTSAQAQNPATPKKTINAGVGCLSAGDTLIVRAGTYNEALNSNTIPSGTSFPAGATTIKKYAGDANPEMRGNVWISARSSIIWDGIDINGIDNPTPSTDGNQETFTNVYINGGVNIRFQNCAIHHAQKLNVLTGDGNGLLSGIEFVNCDVHDPGQGGWTSVNEPANHNFYISAGNTTTGRILIDHCEVYNALGPGLNSWGIQIYCATPGFLNGVVVKNCFIHDNNQPIVVGSGPNHQIYNNVIFNNACANGEAAITVGYGTGVDNIQVYNNTIVGNGAYAISVGTFGAPTNTIIRNNIFWQNTHDSINLAGGSGTVSSNNSTTDPSFINPGTDFHLQDSSAAIGAGLNLSAIFTTDKDGNARPASAAWALGAYETGSGAESDPPDEGTDPGLGEDLSGGSGGVGSGVGSTGIPRIMRTLRIFRDQETGNYSDDDTHDNNYDRDYEGRLESIGHIDRSISWPPGGRYQISDAEVSLADTDRDIRSKFAQSPTPRRRLAEIKAFLDTALSDDVDPVYRGEILPSSMSPGRTSIKLQDPVFSWLTRPIWVLGTRDNFPNLPSGVESEVIPALFGRLESFSADPDFLPQGKFRCPYVDAINFRYAVARHEIFELIAVYRKRVSEGYFKLVDASEYDVVTDTITIEGIAYTMTFIEFHAQQEDGTEIRADASGINSRPAIGALTALSGVEITNLIDHFLNIVYAAEKREDRYDVQSFIDARDEIISRGWVFAYAMEKAETMDEITEKARRCGLDFYCNRNGQLAVSLDPLTDDVDAEGRLYLTENEILENSFFPKNPDQIYNRLRVSYATYGEALKGSKPEWGYSWIVDNTGDQAELAVNPDDPTDLSKEEVPGGLELPFVHDDDTALGIAEAIIGYYAIRAFGCEFDLSLIDFYDQIELGQVVGITHRDGITAPADDFIFGWVNESMKVVGLTYDLDAMTIHVICVKHFPGADLELEATFDPDSGHPARDEQASVVPVGNVSVNANTVEGANFNDTTPAAPNGKRNVKWQRSAPDVSAYVDNFGGVDAQTGTSYTLADTDEGKLVTLSNASAIAVTLPVTFANTYKAFIQNLGAGTATLTPASGTINGAASLALTTGQGCALFFDGTNWKAETGRAGGSSPLTTKGDIWGFSTVDARIPVGANTKVLKADSTQTLGMLWDFVAESELTFTDIATNNSSTSKHGFLKKLDNNAAHFMDGQGNWSTPAGTGPTRGDVAVTTASLADQATESGSLSLGKSSLVYKIVVDQFARVRLYSTSAGRDADVSRDPTTAPSSNADLLLDVVQNTSGTLTFRMMPPAIAQNMDGTVVSTIYYNIQNLSGATYTITATFTRLLLES